MWRCRQAVKLLAPSSIGQFGGLKILVCLREASRALTNWTWRGHEFFYRIHGHWTFRRERPSLYLLKIGSGYHVTWGQTLSHNRITLESRTIESVIWSGLSVKLVLNHLKSTLAAAGIQVLRWQSGG